MPQVAGEPLMHRGLVGDFPLHRRHDRAEAVFEVGILLRAESFAVKVDDIDILKHRGGFKAMESRPHGASANAPRVQAERAHRLYDEALALLPDADRRAQKPGLMMASIYRTLLREIEHDNFQVLHQRIRLTPLRKFWLAWKVQALGRM